MRYFSKFFIALFYLINTAVAQTTETKGIFQNTPQEEHHFMFLLKNRPTEFQDFRAEITKYIWKHFAQEHLKITQLQVGGDFANVPIIHLQAFGNQQKAMDFYHSLKDHNPDFMQMGIITDYFAISKSNYNKLIQAKSLLGYPSFFEKEYLRNQ